ncbi:hypothetical protein GCM10022215_31640 [Nocardioides fonticola]|uniref:IclR-ED domain-containing protein n=1 Tax=Nocardioides fonticola TaxID=450363 RepID=A0ABP7XR63_9ACTN
MDRAVRWGAERASTDDGPVLERTTASVGVGIASAIPTDPDVSTTIATTVVNTANAALALLPITPAPSARAPR